MEILSYLCQNGISMIKFSLPNGKVALLTLDKYLDLTDLDIQNLMADDAGIDIDNPFLDFNIKEPNRYQTSEIEPYQIPEIEEYIEPLPIEEIKKIRDELKND